MKVNNFQSYGFLFTHIFGLPVTPLKEINPRTPEPYASEIMYYAQYDLLERLSRGKEWKFVEVRPDAVVSHSFPLPSHADASLIVRLRTFQ